MAENIELDIVPKISDTAIKIVKSRIEQQVLHFDKAEIRQEAIESIVAKKKSEALQKEIASLSGLGLGGKLLAGAGAAGAAAIGDEAWKTIAKATAGGAAVGGKLGGGLGGAITGGAVGAAVGGFAAIPALVGQLGSFVEAANPAVMEQLNFAFQDITAVIGHALTPIFEAIIPVVQLFGDILATTLDLLSPAFEFLAFVIRTLTEGIKFLISWIPMKSSAFSAAGTTSFVGVGQLTDAAIKGAWGAAVTPFETMNSWLEKIEGNTRKNAEMKAEEESVRQEKISGKRWHWSPVELIPPREQEEAVE